MSDRRVLAMSAAAITLAIMAFLVATYPSWRTAINAGRSNTGVSLIAPGTSPGAESLPQQQTPPRPADAAAMQPAPSSSLAANNAQPQTTSTAALQPAPPSNAGSRPSASAQSDASTKPVDPASDQSTAAEAKPSFDIVRVEPTGDSVVAARATPGADVVLLDQGEPIARAKADANGQVAFVPPTLAPGDHSLMLSVGDPKAPGAISSQSVAVSVPAQAKAAPLVALIAPDQPTKILSGDAAAAASPSADTANSPAPNVAVSTIDVEELGGIYATGKAPPDSHCRVYLNGSFIAAVTAGKDGAWSLKIKRGMRPGRYTVRIDQLQAPSGQVQARAEVPFDYPARMAGASPLLRPKTGHGATGDQASASTLVPPTSGTAPASSASPPANQAAATGAGKPGTSVQVAAAGPAAPIGGDTPSAVVAQLLTTKVVHGDSLWRISRKMLGHGVRYTQIYAANTSQIRDPKLIYPGQIFVLPQNTP